MNNSYFCNMKEHRIMIMLLKYLPVFNALMMMLHCLTLLLGYDWHLAELTCGQCLTMSVLLFVFSSVFRFCWLHKAFILYTMLVQECIIIQDCFGFGKLLTPTRWLMLLIGLALFVVLLFKNKTLGGCQDGEGVCEAMGC